MVTLVVSVVFVLLLSMAQLGSTALCYTCTMAISDDPCMTVTNCSGTTPYCGTARIDGVIMTYMSKFCSAACITASQNLTIVAATETCCTSDLCNNEKLGDVNSLYLGSGGGVLAGGALLLIAVSGLLSAISAM
ncbi:prostate stem cell antigen-like [Ranitomeya imitator]|uniref:prostate stem cell antigen-like n=1 Tax=Ranitomeya imitator TaxID=111125 RepID=UPI0037E84854